MHLAVLCTQCLPDLPMHGSIHGKTYKKNSILFLLMHFAKLTFVKKVAVGVTMQSCPTMKNEKITPFCVYLY